MTRDSTAPCINEYEARNIVAATLDYFEKTPRVHQGRLIKTIVAPEHHAAIVANVQKVAFGLPFSKAIIAAAKVVEDYVDEHGTKVVVKE